MIFFYFKQFIFYTFCITFSIFLLTFFYISSLLFLYSSLNFFTSVLLSFCLSFPFSLIAFSFPSSFLVPLLSPFLFLSRVSYSCFFMRIDQLMVTDLSDTCREYFFFISSESRSTLHCFRLLWLSLLIHQPFLSANLRALFPCQTDQHSALSVSPAYRPSVCLLICSLDLFGFLLKFYLMVIVDITLYSTG